MNKIYVQIRYSFILNMGSEEELATAVVVYI